MDLRRWWKVYNPEGYIVLERATCSSEAIQHAAGRPGYESGCRAELYIPALEQEQSDLGWQRAREAIERIEKCLTEL